MIYKKLIFISLFLIIGPLFVSASNGFYEIPGTGNQFIEPERFSEQLGSNFNEIIDASVSNEKYMEVTESSGNDMDVGNIPSDAIHYDLDLMEADTYYVWLLGFGPSSGSDSFWVNFDNSARVYRSITKYSWGWRKVSGSFNLGAGSHRLTISVREDGSRVDKILITDDGSFVPSGIGDVALEFVSSSNGPPQLVSVDVVGKQVIYTFDQTLNLDIDVDALMCPLVCGVENCGDESLLQSDYLKNDLDAIAIAQGTMTTNLPEYLFVAIPDWNISWRLVNALRMSGHEFGGIEINKLIGQSEILQIDAELAAAEQEIYTRAAQLPFYKDVSGPDFNDNIPQDFAAYMFASINMWLNAGEPDYQHDTRECLLGSLVPHMCGAFVDRGLVDSSGNCRSLTTEWLPGDELTIQTPELFGFNQINYAINDTEYPNVPFISVFSYTGTVLHEFIHDMDTFWEFDSGMTQRIYDRHDVCTGEFMNFDYLGSGPFQYNGVCGEQDQADYVSEYAAGLYVSGQCYRPTEDAAESVEAYIMVPEYFRYRAQNSTILQAKYDYIKNNLFNGVEFSNLQLVGETNYIVPGVLSSFHYKNTHLEKFVLHDIVWS
jgi:hypothetical protein